MSTLLPSTRRAVLTALLALLVLPLLGASAAQAQATYWGLSSSTAPTNLAPQGTGKIIVTATNLGDAVMETTPLVIKDKLPAGLTATAVAGVLSNRTSTQLSCSPSSFPATEVSCTDSSAPLDPFEGLKMTITVSVGEPSGTVTTLKSEASASGGSASPASASEPISISSAAPSFGIEKYALKPEEEGGGLDSQAGSHPFQLTTAVAVNQNSSEEPVELPKNLQFNLPPGLLGNPNAVPQCSQVDFNTIRPGPTNLCGPQTVVGVAQVTIDEPLTFGTTPGTRTVPVFNLEPAAGEPARFGIVVLKVPVVLDTAVRTGSDYGVVVTANETSESAGLVSSTVSFWGVPSDPRHDIDRGWLCVEKATSPECVKQQSEEAAARAKREAEASANKETYETGTPFLSLPTSCGAPLSSPMRAQSWVPGTEYGSYVQSESQETLGGCEELQFNPSISVEPEEQSASTPSGLTVGVRLPQVETPTTLAEAAVKQTTVTLPEGLLLSPGAANGLLACSSFQIGFLGSNEAMQTDNNEFSSTTGSCPAAAKVGSVSIKTPDLKNELTGSVYLANQDTSPFQAPLVIYLIARDPVSGVVVKLAGSVTPNPTTGQLVSTFANTPQVPFEDLKLTFYGGPRASLSTPPTCGSFATNAAMTPWSGDAPATPSSNFSITSGVGAGGCPSSPLPLAPSLQAGSTNTQGGAFTPFSLTIGKPDGQQALDGITVHLPAGMAALLSSITPCPEPPVGQPWACGAESLIGHSTTSSGLGGEPFNLGGSVYITSGYDGAPFGLLVETDAKAGPFDLGLIDVRSRLNVDPSTAAVTITTDGGPRGEVLPTFIKGVPVQLKQIDVTVDRPSFQFNPTSCNASAITGTLHGAQGGEAGVSSPFQVSGCSSLPFAPKLTASVGHQASKANGAGLDVDVESAGLGQSNIAKVDLQLPVALPSRLTTIQKACLAAVFAANPAACDEGSLVGKATIYTPVLKSPLTGPAYLVSHGGAAFPDVEFVLQGEGILLILDGKTDIKKGITYSRFEATPDAPFTRFITELPTGPHSALGAYVPASRNYNLCGTSLPMPTEITAQNGDLIKQTTNIVVTGCKGPVRLTRTQKLKKALAACRKKRSKSKRLLCERQARKSYGGTKSSAKKHKKK